jgi:hypothetical protein
MSISQSAPHWARCCQGAEEVDGIVFNDFRGHLVARFDGDDPGMFAVYYDVTDPSLFWESAQECPLCGHRWARPSGVGPLGDSDAGARDSEEWCGRMASSGNRIPHG